MDISFKCRLCEVSKKRKASIIVHIKVAHMGVKEELFQICCGLCKDLVNQASLIPHIEGHTNELLEKVYAYTRCDLCDFQTITLSGVKRHKAATHGIKSAKCPLCDFTANRGVAMHITKNHPSFRYTCTYPECKLNFRSKHIAAMKRHTSEIHQKNATYKCHICNTFFFRSEYLAAHIRSIHDLDRPYREPPLRLRSGIKRPMRFDELAIEGKDSKTRNKNRNLRRLMNRSK
jgi:hypothetical protein